MTIQFGVDTLLANHPNWKTKNIGFLTNDAATTSKGVSSRKALLDAGFNIVKLFSPEHGISTQGADGLKINNAIDPITKLSIISLYNEKLSPTKEDVEGIEILLFDIPDAGTRFYTYLWSMTYFIEAAATFKLPIYLLDRPNPLGGKLSMAEGPMLDESLSSFIGRFSIPIKHQCTLGELASYFNTTQNWNASLEVIPCKNWNREQLFYDWNSKWINPSPALQNFEACLLYPGLCLFEATNVSVGRGSKFSFEWLGASWFNLPAMAMVWQNILREDIKIETMPLTMVVDNTISEIKGIRIKVIAPNQFNAVLNGLILLKLIKDIHPQQFKWQAYPTNVNPTGVNHLSLLLGIPNAETLFDLPLKDWLNKVVAALKVSHWEKEMQPYLRYT
ncbi:MAG: DUF1343 domain-containing protein [Bacteroidetes bacterium]|nr:DUF1343 domain-containing protein [Bacteroidota bacterium]